MPSLRSQRSVGEIIFLKIIRGWRDDRRRSGDKNLGEIGGEKGDVEVIREGADAAHERSGMGDITRGNGIAETKETAPRDGECVCKVLHGNTFACSGLALCLPPTNPTRHDIIPLIYPLVPSSSWILRVEGCAAFRIPGKRFVKRPA